MGFKSKFTLRELEFSVEANGYEPEDYYLETFDNFNDAVRKYAELLNDEDKWCYIKMSVHPKEYRREGPVFAELTITDDRGEKPHTVLDVSVDLAAVNKRVVDTLEQIKKLVESL